MAAFIFHACGLRSVTHVSISVLGIGCLFLLRVSLFAFGYVCVQRSVSARGSAFLLVPLHEGKECRARA